MRAHLRDIIVEYSRSGQGPAAVLVHGLAEDHSSWRSVQNAVSDHRLYAYDLRGHGETTLGEPDGTLAQLRDDLIEFIVRVSGPAVLVGYSLGGTVVLAAAAERPDLVRRVIVAGTSSIVGRKAGEFFEHRIQSIEQDFTRFASELKADTAAQLAIAANKLDAVAEQRLRAVGSGRGYINAARAMKRLVTEPLTPILGRITCPVDVIGGEQDIFCPPKAAAVLMQSLANAHYHEIPGAGHLMSIDCPELYANAISQTLERDRK